MKVSIVTRISAVALGTVVAATAVATDGVAVRGAPNPNPTMIPLLEVKRVTSADHVFIDKAIAMAIASMESANAEIGVANTVDVQNEAVRAFNTSAEAYNALADVASKREMKYLKPRASQLDDTPALAQDAKPGPQDVQYVGQTQRDLEAAIALYHNETQHGKDKLAVDLAVKLRPRFEHDLALVTIDIENMNHPKFPPVAPAPPGTESQPPDPASSPPPPLPSPSP